MRSDVWHRTGALKEEHDDAMTRQPKSRSTDFPETPWIECEKCGKRTAFVFRQLERTTWFKCSECRWNSTIPAIFHGYSDSREKGYPHLQKRGL